MQYVPSRSGIGDFGLLSVVRVSETEYTHTDSLLYNTALIINP